MIRAIRHVKTGDYFQKGKWTPDFDEAQKLDGVTALIKVCVAFKLKDVEMVMRMDPERPDLRIPIPNPKTRWRRTPLALLNVHI